MEELLTIADVARHLKLKKQTIYKWVQEGKITGFKIGAKEWRIKRSVLESWIEQQAGAA